MSEITSGMIREIDNELEKILNILKKEDIKWPYQKVSLNEFNRVYFPHIDDVDELKKYHSLKPQQLITVVENKLRTINSMLKPLEENLKALKFQYQLFNLFSIFEPNQCIKILKKTPRGIREDFTNDKSLELASIHNINQKQVAEIMNLWLNMRYYGALACSLSPKFIIPVIQNKKLKERIESIKKNIEKSEPDLLNRHNLYKNWIYTKQKLDEERKLMSFGPENVQVLEDSLNKLYELVINGEVNRDHALKIIHLIDEILIAIENESKKKKKSLIPKDKRENINKLKELIKNKPKEFFDAISLRNKFNFLRV
ncbi:MAG: hypothetical protein ACTSPQ_06140 [Candidatus Helarchaeota archaeon]